MESYSIEIRQLANGWIVEVSGHAIALGEYPTAYYETEQLAKTAAAMYLLTGRIPNGEVKWLDIDIDDVKSGRPFEGLFLK